MHPIQQKLLSLSNIRDLSKMSLREIGRQISNRTDGERIHPQLVKYHLGKLVDANLLARQMTPTLRGVSKPDGGLPSLVSIPLVGSANCGPATIFAEEQILGYVKMSPSLLKSKNYQNLFALQASGDSMNRAPIDGTSIEDGDYVLVDASMRTPRGGEYVVVVYDNVANIKRIFFDYQNQQIALVSESTYDYKPIFIDPKDSWDGLISGTVIQVVKKPRAQIDFS